MLILKRFLKDDSGATAVEYALLAALMSAAIIGALGAFKDDLKTAFTNIGAKLTANTK